MDSLHFVWQVQRLGPRIYAYCQMIPEEVCSTLDRLFCGLYFRTSMQYLTTLHSALKGSQNIRRLKGGKRRRRRRERGSVVGGKQRLCFQLNGLPGYMRFTCITVIYCDNSTTPTDNTALLQIRGITKEEQRGRRRRKGREGSN